MQYTEIEIGEVVKAILAAKLKEAEPFDSYQKWINENSALAAYQSWLNKDANERPGIRAILTDHFRLFEKCYFLMPPKIERGRGVKESVIKAFIDDIS